jgi:hypothetical protein
MTDTPTRRRPQPRRTPSGMAIVGIPGFENLDGAENAIMMTSQTTRTFVGESTNTEVQLHITQQGRVEIKIRRNGEFCTDLYVQAE